MKPDDEATRLGVVTVERELLFNLLAHCISARRQLGLIDQPNLKVAASRATANINHIGARLAVLARARHTCAMFSPEMADSAEMADSPETSAIPPSSAPAASTGPVLARAATVNMRPPTRARATQPPAPPARVFRDRPFLPGAGAEDEASEDGAGAVVTSAPRMRP